MGRFSFRILKVFSRLGRSLRPAVRRFPALFVLGLVMAVAVALHWAAVYLIDEWDACRAFKDRMEGIAFACLLGMVFSVAVQLLFERRIARGIQFALQAAVVVLSPVALAPFIMRLDEVHRYLAVAGVSSALIWLVFFLLARLQRTGTAVANLVVAAVVAGISTLCAMAGLLLVYFALTTLVVNLAGAAKEFVETLCYFVPLCVMGPGVFVALATRARDEISVPAAYRAVVLRILFPLAVALLFVLYVYLAKCLFTLTMPVGKINPFASTATAAYLFLYFASLSFGGRVVAFFRRHGVLFMLPLVAAQIAAFAIRIGAYGYTAARVASLLYIAFSIVACALTFVRGGRHAHVSFLVFAAVCFVGGVGPCNIVDVANRSQIARIVRIYRAHGLLADGVPVAAGAADVLTTEEMRAVRSAWRAIERNSRRIPDWARTRLSNFVEAFGFEWDLADDDGSYDLEFHLTAREAVLDVSAYSCMLPVHQRVSNIQNEIAVLLRAGDETLDLTGALRPLMVRKNHRAEDDWKQEPLRISLGGGRTFILTFASITEPHSADGGLQGGGDYTVEGFLCW